MTIAELFLALYVSDFTVPELQQIQKTVKEMKECNAMPEPTADCKNVLRQYLEMKEKIGRSNADVQ
jgi:hypothetical protein